MPTSTVRFKLFGRFQAIYQGQPIEDLDTGKASELLVYLLLNHERPHSRESLSEILWEAKSTSQAKKYLRQTIWQLQNVLPAPSKEQEEPILNVEQDWIYLNPKADFHLDITDLEEAKTLALDRRGEDLSAEELSTVEAAVLQCDGDLLEGWYQEWCLFERERLQNIYLQLLDKLIAAYDAQGVYEKGIQYAHRSLRSEPGRERTYYALMRLFYLIGDRSSALRQYERCVVSLADQLNVEPARRTQELYSQIANDQLIDLRASASPPTTEERRIVSSELSGTIHMVHQLDAVLNDLKRHLQQDLELSSRQS